MTDSFPDNGGAPREGGYNWPLRGSKGRPWEGAIRVPAFIYSELLASRGVVRDGVMHITDWFPTILNLAGGNSALIGDMDGMDMWQMIR